MRPRRDRLNTAPYPVSSRWGWDRRGWFETAKQKTGSESSGNKRPPSLIQSIHFHVRFSSTLLSDNERYQPSGDRGVLLQRAPKGAGERERQLTRRSSLSLALSLGRKVSVCEAEMNAWKIFRRCCPVALNRARNLTKGNCFKEINRGG